MWKLYILQVNTQMEWDFFIDEIGHLNIGVVEGAYSKVPLLRCKQRIHSILSRINTESNFNLQKNVPRIYGPSVTTIFYIVILIYGAAETKLFLLS